MKKRKREEETFYREVINRLQTFEEALWELSKFQEPEEEGLLSPKGVEYIFTAVSEDVCRKCPKYRECYGERQKETLEEIYAILKKAEKSSRVEAGMASAAFRKKCIYFQPFMEELFWLFCILYQNHRWEKSQEALRRIMRKQAKSQYLFMRECRKMLTGGIPIEGRQRRVLKRSLLARGISLLDVSRMEEEGGAFLVCLSVRPIVVGKKTEEIGKVLSLLYGKRMVSASDNFWLKRGKHRLLFIEEGSFHVMFGCCHESKKGEKVCGDTYSFRKEKEKKVVMAISDGMGAGEKAYEESRKTMETFEALLAAGMEEEYALEMLHNSFIAEKETSYATLDVVSISLQTGMMKSLKAGGSASFILHGQSVERLHPLSLPPGCLENQRFAFRSKKLYHGDIVVMLSDGMLGFEMTSEKGEKMEHLLKEIRTENAQAFAEELMRRLPAPGDGGDDDRTVLVASVWEKRGNRGIE
ncbi:MAG: SpoIIE family protein phosphatase [Eubacteriales bacterium]|nr:SpoIIE family protein phosphatase [Eubacteriales bacterium]